MSLLLLFPQGTGQAFKWVCQIDSITGPSWTISTYEFLNRWGDWSGRTWGQIGYTTTDSANGTWAFMAGDIFVDATQPVTNWAIVATQTGA